MFVVRMAIYDANDDFMAENEHDFDNMEGAFEKFVKYRDAIMTGSRYIATETAIGLYHMHVASQTFVAADDGGFTFHLSLTRRG